MPYVKPGVEVTQVEQSQSPVLITPELQAVVIGPAYDWLSPYSENAKCPAKLVIDSNDSVGTDATFDITTVGAAGSISAAGDAILESSIVVDLICTKGANVGRRFHADAADFSITTTVITVSQTANGVAYDADVTFTDADEFDVYVGFLFQKISALGLKTIEGLSDIRTQIGEPKTFNPLGYGAKVAMQASGTQIQTYGYEADTSSDNASDHVANLDLASEVYAIAPMDQDGDMDSFKNHVEGQSLPTVKHERIVFINPPRSSDIADGLTSTTRGESATNIQQANAVYMSKRVFSIHPDRGYVLETRHVSTLTSAWIIASFASTAFTTIVSAQNDLPILATDLVTPTATYKAGVEVSATMWADLVKNGWGEQGEVSVYVPVPGYYYSAGAAGTVISMPIQQPMTYHTVPGIDRTYGAADMFSEANLNTMAEGGTFILTQDSKNSPIYCRHQLSTDVTTIERKELSITKQVDYVAKYLRKVLTKYAGRYNITPSFIALVQANLMAVGADLMRNGIIAGFDIVNVYQDDLTPDVVRADVDITVKYPANYIKVRLIV